MSKTGGDSGLQAALSFRRGPHQIVFEASVPAGGVTALFGASGVGKSSCLRVIAGLDRAATGTLRFDGTVWHDSIRGVFTPPHRRRIGYVSQDPSLFGHLDVGANLDFAFRRAGRPAHVRREDLIDQFKLGALLKRRVGGLSGGERQRVAIVRALLSDPKLLLFDEPLSGLDEAARRDLMILLEALVQRLQAPMIYVSHAIEEVARLADHLVVLDQGRVSAQGPLSSTITRADLPAALIEAAGAVIEGVVVGHDETDQLTEIRFDGGALLLARNAAGVGDRVRCRVAARDVVLMLERPSQTSALNHLACQVVAIGNADHPSQCLIQLDANGAALLARITRRSLNSLDLSPGKAVWAQVKAVALGA